jgi:hypothetical protein
MNVKRKIGAVVATVALAVGMVAVAPSGPAVADTSWGRIVLR